MSPPIQISWMLMIIPLILKTCQHPTGSTNPGGAEHHTPEGYRNLYVDDRSHTTGDFFKWRLNRGERPNAESADQIPTQPVNREAVANPGLQPQITWVGHSTVLIQHRGVNVLTDPILSQRGSPFQFAGPRRLTAPALDFATLPPIDYVVLSHNHYDHLDRNTVNAIGNSATWLVPLGHGAWFERVGVTRVRELDWWDSFQEGGVIITCTPSQHWTKRFLFKAYDTLWSSWAIRIGKFRFWFGGDTGYNPVQFREIGERLGPFDGAAIPIGGYAPRWFMSPYHVNPAEAVQIHRDLRSQWSCGIHWGTFILSDEPILEPLVKLAAARDEKGVPEDQFVTLKIGQTKVIPLPAEQGSPSGR